MKLAKNASNLQIRTSNHPQTIKIRTRMLKDRDFFFIFFFKSTNKISYQTLLINMVRNCTNIILELQLQILSAGRVLNKLA